MGLPMVRAYPTSRIENQAAKAKIQQATMRLSLKIVTVSMNTQMPYHNRDDLNEDIVKINRAQFILWLQ